MVLRGQVGEEGECAHDGWWEVVDLWRARRGSLEIEDRETLRRTVVFRVACDPVPSLRWEGRAVVKKKRAGINE